MEKQESVRPQTEGGIIEIPGKEGNKKAELLKSKLTKIIEKEANVSRPVIRGDIRVIGFDESITSEDLRTVLSKKAGCDEQELRVGVITPMRNGLWMTWVQGPLAAVIRAASVRRIQVGWLSARIELLESKPVQCFRCWGFGHVRSNCRSEKSRFGQCFKCGEQDHTARQCNSEVRCIPCQDIGKRHDHRMGNNFCEARKIASRRNRPAKD